MPGRSSRVVLGLLIAALVGCAPSPTPSPSATPPPIPADFVPWPDLVWTPAELPPRPGAATNERVAAVAASRNGFAAVGYRETGDVRDGVAWSSVDGLRWSAAADPAFKGIELVDVAEAPSGFTALGVASPDGEHPTAVVFASADGKTWQRLAPLPTTGDTYPGSIAGGSGGVLVVGSDAVGAVAAWRSGDGRTFRRVTLTGPAGDGLVDPHAIDGGFLALGTKDGAPALLRSADGTSWDAAQIDTRTDADASTVVGGRWGIVAQGVVSPDCDPNSESCVPTDLGWWSLDGKTWVILPAGDSPVVNGVSLLIPAGDHGLLAIDGADAWSSPDGWAWRPLPEPGDGTIDIDDAVVRNDTIVAVGTQPSDVDDTSDGRIVVGRSPLADPSEPASSEPGSS
jgi:hypothetical protein